MLRIEEIKLPHKIEHGYEGCSKGSILTEISLNGTTPLKQYLKFSNENTDQIWNEFLADRIYKVLGVLVPETKIVQVDKQHARSSNWIEGHVASKEEFNEKGKNGFIADCLISNWDIPAKPSNSMIEDQTGDLYRLDNGGALLFRACGKKKDNLFTEVVGELESTKHSYPELTEEDIKIQVQILKEKFTNEAIEEVVDDTFLSEDDKKHLKKTLKARRDFITSYYNKKADSKNEIPPIGREVEEILLDEKIDEGKLSKILLEWTQLPTDQIKNEIKALKTSPEFNSLTLKEKHLMLMKTLFLYFGKPRRKIVEWSFNDPNYREWSLFFASKYMMAWGYSRDDIRAVNDLILSSNGY